MSLGWVGLGGLVSHGSLGGFPLGTLLPSTVAICHLLENIFGHFIHFQTNPCPIILMLRDPSVSFYLFESSKYELGDRMGRMGRTSFAKPGLHHTHLHSHSFSTVHILYASHGTHIYI